MNAAARDSLHNAIAALERAATKPTAASALIHVAEAMDEICKVIHIVVAGYPSKRCTPKRKRGKLVVMPANPNHPEGPGAA